MVPGSEVVLPISSQKHDPAWKHCLLIKADDRTQLKCMYCSKIFLGGGIHRIKEHLARHKGNASSCLRVPEDVQQAMKQSLEAVEARRKRKMKLAEELDGLNHVANQMDTSEVDNGLQLVAVPELLDTNASQGEAREEGMSKGSERGRRKRVRCSPPLLSMTGVCIAGSTEEKNHVYMAIARFLYEAGVPLDAVNSNYFQPMVDAIASAGPGLKLPSYHDFRGWILKRSVEEVNITLEHYKETWVRTGCTILADEWTTVMGQTLINFLVYCPEGMMFLKSVDASNIVTSTEALYELLKHVVEEVGVTNVVQVITNNTKCHVLAGKWLTETFPTMFWMPCAAQSIDSMLEELGRVQWISDVIDAAKSITEFIYNHGVVLNFMRKYTNGKDFILPSETQSAIDFVTLKRMICLKDELTTMVNSQEWTDCPYTQTMTGVAMAEVICGSSFWSSCEMVIQLTDPLIQVLRTADSSKRPAMGYIYAGMYQVKETIKKQLINKDEYMPYWDIIDRAWDRRLPHPLHAAGFFLNPRYIYSVQEIPKEISSGMLECIKRLVPELRIHDKINKELSLYKNASGDFGRKMAIRARDTLLPAEWWSTYGGGCPNLTRLAIRILSQTCSARGCEQSHHPFEKIHYQRINYLEHQRLRDLVFVQYNLQLQQRKVMKNKLFDPISVDNINNVNDWVIEKSELLSGEEDFSWMLLNQPVAYGVLSEYENHENVETFITEFDDEIISGAGQDLDDAYCKREDGSHDGISFKCTQKD